MISPETSAKIAEWRRKCADKTITVDELREAILVMREARRSAVTQTNKGKSKAPPKDVDSMLRELEGL